MAAVAATSFPTSAIDLGTAATGLGDLAGAITRSSGGGSADILRNISRAVAGAGNDTLLGTPGDDTLGGGTGSSRIDGRGAYNTISYTDYVPDAGTPRRGVTVNLTTGTASTNGSSTYTLVGIQAVLGSDFDDITGVVVAGGRSLLRGNAGADTLSAPSAGTAVTADGYYPVVSGCHEGLWDVAGFHGRLTTVG